MINDLKLLALLSSRDAIIQPIFTLKKCVIYPQQTAKNMYIHHFLFLKGFLYTNILFKIPLVGKEFLVWNIVVHHPLENE